MPVIKLPIQNVYKNLDEISLTNNSTALINGYLDETNSFNKWYGDETDINLSLGNVGIDASYYWEEKQLQIVICDGKFFKIDNYKTITELTGVTFNKGIPIDFHPIRIDADETPYLYMCDGGNLKYTDGISIVISLSTTVHSMAFINGYIVKIDGISRNFEIGVSDSPTDVTYPLSLALSDKRKIKSICKGESSDVLAVSDNSYEKLYASGSDNVFDKIQGSYGSIGIKAPKTLKYFNNSWVWLSNDLEIVQLQGTILKSVECPFEKTIQEYTTVDDAYSYIMKPFGKKYYVIVFPTEKKTIIWEFKTNKWFELYDWDGNTSDWDLWYGSCYSYNPLWNEHLIGSRKYSKLYKISLDKYSHDGQTIRSLIRLGNFDYGISSKQKQIVKRTYTVLRGKVDMGDLTTNPKLLVRSRINGSSEWEQEREVYLGKIGDTLYQGFEYSNILGTPFYQRQEEIVVTDNVPLILKEIEDEFNVEE